MSKREEELLSSIAQYKDTMTCMEKVLYASNAKLRWFEYELGEIERQLGEVNLRSSSLEERVRTLDIEVEL